MSKNSENQKKFRDRRASRIFEYLGGRCVVCGVTYNLEVDHIDPSTKSFDPKVKSSLKWETLIHELDKCQLLCCEHHTAKHTRQLIHGINGYTHFKCRCEVCVLAWREYIKKYRRSKGIKEKTVAKHGSPAMYSYHKCRCVLCKAWQRERMCKYRNSKLEQRYEIT